MKILFVSKSIQPFGFAISNASGIDNPPIGFSITQYAYVLPPPLHRPPCGDKRIEIACDDEYCPFLTTSNNTKSRLARGGFLCLRNTTCRVELDNYMFLELI